MTTVGGMFVAAVRDYPERTFLRWCRDGARIRWSYAEAAVRVEALCAQLDALGVARGDHVVVHTAAMVPSILFDLACACAGVVFTPIETDALPEVIDIWTRTGAKAVLTTPERAHDGHARIAIDGREGVDGDRGAALARLATRVADLEATSVYMLQPTSATTGPSKLVIRPHAAFERIARVLGFGLERAADPPARVLMVAALTHGMGQYLLAIAMSLAAELCVTTRIDVAADLEEIRWLDPTYLGLTPRVLRSLVQQAGGPALTGQLFGPSARFVMSGGAAPDPDLLALVERTGVTVVNAYGASEISVVAMTRPGSWRPDVLGHVLDDVTLRVSDEGELLAHTPVMMYGYHGAPELTREAFTADRFYRTGDRVEIGPDGEFRYHGRLVDRFNLFDGSHVTPGPIEDTIARLPWVEQVVLIGDQRPYVTGLLVARGAVDAALVARDLGRINAELPSNARLRRVAVLAAALPAEVHQFVGHGKVRRDRAAALARFAEVVAALYGARAPAGALVVELS